MRQNEAVSDLPGQLLQNSLHARAEHRDAFATMRARMQEIRGPFIQLRARDHVPKAALPRAEIHLGQSRIDPQWGSGVRCDGLSRDAATPQRAGDDGIQNRQRLHHAPQVVLMSLSEVQIGHAVADALRHSRPEMAHQHHSHASSPR